MHDDELALNTTDQNHLDGQLVMPFYLICDQSYSMVDQLPQLRAAVDNLIRAVAQDPIVDDTVMLSVISFGTKAEVTVPLSRLSDITLPEKLTEMSGTAFGNAWTTYAETFEADFKQLKSAGAKVFRPCVFFMTDGEPGDKDFRKVFDRTLGRSSGEERWPYVIAFGFREAPPEVLAQLAYPDSGEKLGRWFHSDSKEIPDVLQAIAGMIGQSVMTSGQSASTPAGPQLTPPTAPDGTFQQGNAGSVDTTF